MKRVISLIRGPYPVGLTDAGRASLCALLGLASIAFISRILPAPAGVASWLIPPIGSSAVLVFALPASPLAQPRAVLGGNIVSAFVGVASALLIREPVVAAAVAVSASILAMAVLGCLHPPGGAVALGASMTATSFAYLLPVTACSLLLVVAAVGLVRLTGRSYPHKVAATASIHGTRDRNPVARFGYSPADLDHALSKYGELLDVSRDDLDALFRQVELEAHARLHTQIKCEDIMSRDVLSVHADQSAQSALTFLQQHDLRTAPVVDDTGRVVGLARRAELLGAGRRLVGEVLDPFAHKVRPTATVESLLPLLSTGESHEVMVVDEHRRLIGLITQTDLLAVLYRTHIVEAVVGGAPPAANDGESAAAAA